MQSSERFEALFADQSRALLGYALRRAERPEDAADVVAEVMLVAWRRLDEVPAGDEARPWLFGVARRVLSNHHRSATRRTRLSERLRLEVGPALEPDIALARADADGATVRAALRALPEADRELLALIAWEGLAPSEAAGAMGLSPGAVRVRLHRARARLRRELLALGWPGERYDGEQLLVPATEESR